MNVLREEYVDPYTGNRYVYDTHWVGSDDGWWSSSVARAFSPYGVMCYGVIRHETADAALRWGRKWVETYCEAHQVEWKNGWSFDRFKHELVFQGRTIHIYRHRFDSWSFGVVGPDGEESLDEGRYLDGDLAAVAAMRSLTTTRDWYYEAI